MSPGYAYERAPDQEHFLNRTKTKKLFRDVFALGKGKKWNFMHSGLFLDFLAGNQDYECTPWGMPARNIFGWQKPCYLLGEGYTKTFKELMDTTDWETYGTGKYEKCADCMAHCGYEPTAANAALTNPLKAMWVALRGVRTTGPMAPEINLDQAASGAVHLLGGSAEAPVGDPPRRSRRAPPRRSKRHRRPPEPPTIKQNRARCDRALFSFESLKRTPRLPDPATRPSPPSRKPRQPRRLRSARLKSIPVETSARSVGGLRATPRSTLRRSISPFGLIAVIASAGKARVAGSLMTRSAANGKPGLGGIVGRNMAFHVDGRSARSPSAARPCRPGRRPPARRPPGRP